MRFFARLRRVLRDTSGCHPHSFYTETRNPIENINRAGNFIFFPSNFSFQLLVIISWLETSHEIITSNLSTLHSIVKFQFCGKKSGTILILCILKSLLHFLKAKDILNDSLPWKREKIKFKVLNFANSQVNFIISFYFTSTFKNIILSSAFAFDA